ncbi:hypothetical protein TTRE_0000094801 [Trichuris trichiura]|uniref:F-box domain-containing protein n=1 Tax=Trichuris trichiura TaxID=36087 RepID=A0A077YY37_TRITR|nr:hypothetical protein TTRE_0000094801 [Trichuris trichiura]
MILLVKFKGRCEQVHVEPTITLKNLEEVSKKLFKVERESLYLSLNKQDPVGAANATLMELGLVEKDCLHLISYSAERSDASSSEVPGTKPKVVQLPSLRPIDVLEETFAKAFRDGMPNCTLQNEMEVLSTLVYVAFIAQRFRNPDDSVGIPSDWRDLSSAKFFKFILKHPVTGKMFKITCTSNIAPKVNATAFVQAEDLWDPSAQVHSVSIPLGEVPREVQRGVMSESIKVFLCKVYNSLVKKVYGAHEPPYLAQLPQFPVLVISKYLSVKDFSNLTRTCKELHRHWDDGLFWKQMFSRDFKVIVPPDEFPGIGGPSDLHPILDVPYRLPDIFPSPRAGPTFPSMRGRVPGGPRYDPPFPIDPEGRIRLQPPGRRHPRPDPDSYFPPFL